MNAFRHAPLGIISLLLFLPPLANAESGFYVGAGLGRAGLDDDFDGLSVDTDATAFRIVAGWRFSEYFSAEFGYQDFGNFSQTVDNNGAQDSISLTADGYTIGAGGAYPLGDRLSLTGRLGWFFWDGNAEINSVSQATPEDTNLFYGVGIAYSITGGFAVTGDWSRFDLDDTQSDMLSVGFTYRFGS